MTLTAVLFAGGESRRMGRDKATLVIAGQPLWARQIEMLGRLNADKVLVSARQRPAWCPREIDVTLDASPPGGPLNGLAAALQQLGTTHLLALAIDLPRMSAVHLQMLWSLATPGCGVIPRHGDYFEPLCAIYPVEAAATVGRALLDKDTSLQRVVQILLEENRMRIHALFESEKPLYHNVNTPADV